MMTMSSWRTTNLCVMLLFYHTFLTVGKVAADAEDTSRQLDQILDVDMMKMYMLMSDYPKYSKEDVSRTDVAFVSQPLGSSSIFRDLTKENGCGIIERSSIFGNNFYSRCDCESSGASTTEANASDGSNRRFEASCPAFCAVCSNDLGICVTSSWNVTYNSPVSSQATATARSQGESNETMTTVAFSDSNADRGIVLLHQIGTLQYSGNRDDVVTYEAMLDSTNNKIVSCSLTINGELCNECRASTSTTGNSSICSPLQHYYDCSNIESGLVIDQCAGDDGRLASTSLLIALNNNYFNFIDCFLPLGSFMSNDNDGLSGSANKSRNLLVWATVLGLFL